MKILYFTPFFPPQGEAAASRAYWFVKVLKEAGHLVQVLNASEFKLRPATNKDRAILRLIKENLTGLELFFRILTSRNDMLVLSSPPFFTVLWGAVAGVLSGQKYILDVRDLYPEIFFEMKMIKEHSIIGKIAKYFTTLLYKNALSVITVTHGLCREIETYGTAKPHLIMNGYDPVLFYPGKDDDKFPKLTLVFHGTLGKVQNIETLLKLSRALEDDDLEILVAGEGSKSSEILKANRPNIRFLGSLPYNEIPPLLRKCHIGLSFRTDDKIGKEAFPVKVFEYVGCGLQVIMSPPGEAGAIIQKLGYGWEFRNDEIEKMAETIRQYRKQDWHMKKVEGFSRYEQAKRILNLF